MTTSTDTTTSTAGIPPLVISRPPAERDLAAALPVADKVALVSGADSWRTRACPQAGLRAMVTSDGPNGVRGTSKDERHPSACLPSPSALGATWDAGLVQRLGAALGAEARSKGVDILLGPTVNLMRTPLGGRGFEFFAEDPVLTAGLASAYVRGVQSAGVAATIKHYVANETETGRRGYDARISESVLRELYLLPFEACIREAGAWLVMAAYNQVNGATMTENLRLLRDVLKNEWGFDGVVVSDWHAARSTAATALATLDLSMPGPEGPWGGLLLDAVRDGVVTESLLDDKVARLLRLARRVGALSGTALSGAGTAAGAAPAGGGAPAPVGAALLRQAAAESFVLLRNHGDVLPLDRAQPGSLAVIGPNAISPVIQGGGSAGVTPVSVSVPAAAIRAAAGDARVSVLAGCQTWHTVPEPPAGSLTDPQTGTPGLHLEFTDGEGRVVAAEHRASASLAWWDGIPGEVGWGRPGAVVLTAVFAPQESGSHLMSVAGVGGLVLEVDGVPVIDGITQVPGDPVEAMTRPGELRAAVPLEAGRQARIRVTFRPAEDGDGPLAVRLGIIPVVSDDELIAAAVAAAAAADTAVVVVGSAELTESEGFDRPALDLPGRQDELVSRVAAVNARTVVVVNSGMPVLMPWAGQVAAIIWAWLPGQEFGTALADVLFGDAEPGGRLPVTIPADGASAPVLHAEPGPGGALRYDEGLLIGYRGYDAAGLAPAYPFGAGRGYTTWEYESLDGARWLAGGDLELTARVRNTGTRPGKEVVQAYLAGPGGPAPGRPVRTLAAFGVARSAPGETARVTLTIPARSLARYDEQLACWITGSGEFTLAVGPSSREARLTAAIRPAAP